MSEQALGGYPLGRVHCADCLQVLPRLPDGCFEAIITDPVWPNSSELLPGATDPFGLFARAAEHFPRLARTVIIHLGCGSDPRILSGMPASIPFFRIIWADYAVPSYQGRLLNSGDVIYVFGEPPSSRPGRRVLPGRIQDSRKPEFPRGVGRNRPHGASSAAAEKMPHPAMRRLKHVRWLVDCYCDRGPVLDPFAGGGTTGVACVGAGIPFLGFEIEPRFADFANERIAAAGKGLSYKEYRAGQRHLNFDG